jgi:two-component system cell cycle sensor histidine kinase/response regulator CckA
MTRILIADDHEANRLMLRTLLEGNGYEAQTAAHGEAALEQARQSPPDVIISDLMMPVMDGYTLLRQWRADPALNRRPFIVYTATFTEAKDEQLAFTLGADAFLVKPLEPEELLARIREVLARAASGELSAARGQALDETALLQAHNAVLINKLEQKASQLEASNTELREEIAERKRTEADLRESEERFRATFEQAAVGIAHVAPDGQFLRVNNRFCEMTGYESDELLRLTFQELTLADDRDEGEAARQAMLARRQAAYSAEKRYLNKRGQPFWVGIVTTLLWDQSGAPKYFITVITDVTERKTLEDQLRQAQKMEAVGLLAGGVAHDFNNLLTVISGYGDMMLAAPMVTDLDREALKAIMEAGDRATALTGQLLGFSRQTILQPKVLDLNPLVKETARLLGRLIGEDIQLTTTLAADLRQIKVDPGHLDQVLLNLAVNARDAMPTGGRLTIETANLTLGDDYAAFHVDLRPGAYVMLAISDTGCGMTPEVRARIFEPFFTTKGVGKGTGLGLPMVFGIVKQSDGAIHVYSEPGHGTTFKIYFPAVGESVAATEPEGHAIGPRGNETILLVEDEPGVRGLATLSLQGHGYHVLAATDGDEAWRIAQEHHASIDLVLADVVMPNLGGTRLAEQLRERFPRIKMLLMSGYTDDAIVRHGLLKADTPFIQKPYTPLSLAQKVRQVLDDTG